MRRNSEIGSRHYYKNYYSKHYKGISQWKHYLMNPKGWNTNTKLLAFFILYYILILFTKFISKFLLVSL